MSIAPLAFKLTLPTLFFGYAVAANVALFSGDEMALTQTGIARGELTAEIDDTYRAHLPHKDPSVGVIGALRYALLGEGREGVVVGAESWLFTAEEFRFATDAPRSIAETVADMAVLRDQLRAMGAELVVLPLPTKLEVEATRAPDGNIARQSAAEYDRFASALRAQGLPFYDSRAAFAAQAPGTAFFRTDTHWTPQTAEALAVALAETQLVERGTDQFERVDAKPVAFQGDLVTFITSEGLAPFVGLRPETVTPWVAEPAAGATGDLDLFGGGDTVDVALVGTSYSANPNWSFVEALKVALGRDVLNLAAEGQGPVVPMIDFVETGVHALDTVPEVVLWEFPVRYLADPALWPAEKETPDA